MNIEDFLPKYPNIDKSDVKIANPYSDDFYISIYKKKEFYENRLERIEEFPSEKGMLLKHQQTIARFLSSHTPYDRILLIHAMGSGKTCSAIGAIEQIKREHSTIRGAIIVAKGKNILDNFVNELLFKCTGGEYIPENFDNLTAGEKIRRINKKRGKFYSLKTMQKFSKELASQSDSQIEFRYSNRIIVIDEVHNLRIQAEKKAETMQIYQQYHRFLHLVKNCKIVLMSGTPMKDSPEEIASVMNLLLPMNKQLPLGELFIQQYMYKEGSLKVRPDKIPLLKELMKGKVSYLRTMESDVKKVYIGEKLNGLKHFICAPDYMSPFQSKYYAQAYIDDTSGQRGVFNNSREASLFVYPDGSYGTAGFHKYIKRKEGKRSALRNQQSSAQYSMDEKLLSALRGNTVQDVVNNISKYSSKYASVISQILGRPNQCCFIYSSIVRGSGAILFSLLLELLGYRRATGRESSEGLRYAILTGETTTKTELNNIRDRFNSPENMFGKYIQVIIGSRTVSEGISFKHIQFECILTPHFNYSETAQALARGIRLNSHNDLIEAKVDPVVDIMQCVSIPEAKYNVKSIDLYLYLLSEDKDISIQQIVRIIMECSFDCALSYFRNRVYNQDGQRDCQYTSCEYKCDGVNMGAIRDGLSNDEIDYSTYQLYYANPEVPAIHRRIEQLFRKNTFLSIDDIVKNLKDEYSEWQIYNSLQLLNDQVMENFELSDYLNNYTRTVGKSIMNRVERLFRSSFYLSLDTILQYFPDNTEFEVVSALKELIDRDYIIINRYGFMSYLREENNIYFLVSNISSDSTFFSSYYSMYPNIMIVKSFYNLAHQINEQKIPRLIRKLFRSKNPAEFEATVKYLPLQTQELLLEGALTAEDQKIEKGSYVRGLIQQYFFAHVKRVHNVWVSTLLEKKDNVLRCSPVNAPFSGWEDCPPGYENKIFQAEQEEEQKIKDNPYQLLGKYNPQNKMFCLVDLRREQKSKEKIRQKKTEEKVDTRAHHSGRVCGQGGWKIDELMEFAIDRLKMPPSDNFMIDKTDEYLKAEIKSNTYLNKLFSSDHLAGLSRDEMRRYLYWALPPARKGRRSIKDLCAELEHWFHENGLMIIDRQCGVQAKTKKIKQDKKKKEVLYRIEEYVAKSDYSKLEKNVDLGKMMKDCYKLGRFTVDSNDDKWYLAYVRKIAACIVVRNDVIIQACVGKNVRDRVNVIAQLVQRAGVNKLQLANTDPNYTQYRRRYTKYGFTVDEDNGTITTMSFKN